MKTSHSRIERLEARIAPATLTVTTTADAGAGSLRQAILDANATPEMDRIVFDFPGNGPFVIAPTSELPDITAPVKILGNTQPGLGGGSVIDLDGAAAGAGANGLTLDDHFGSTIRGMAIHGFDGNGILVTGGGDHVIAGNFIGSTVTGNLDGNGGNGISLHLFGGGNRIGGDSRAERNIIVDNGGYGILVSQTSDTKITGNHIGVLGGVVAGGNALDGIKVASSAGTVIGGPSAKLRNVISANGELGIDVTGADSVGTRIAGNYIGTDKSGMAALANTNGGLGIRLGPSESVVGGPTAAHGNLISGNGDEGVVVIDADENTIRSNRIGVKADGTQLGNASHGVSFGSGASENEILKNRIAHNGGDGISMTGLPTNANRVFSNRIYNNDGLGIDLGDDGVTLNDVFDLDVGPNNLANFPTLTAATLRADGFTVIEGGLLMPSATATIQIFIAAADPSGHGEGSKLVGSFEVAGTGGSPLTWKFTTNALKAGQILTALVIASGGATSEFSENVAVELKGA